MTNLVYLATLLLVARAVLAGMRLDRLRWQGSPGSLAAALRAVARARGRRPRPFAGCRLGASTALQLLLVVSLWGAAGWFLLLERAPKAMGLDETLGGDAYRLVILLAFALVTLPAVLLARWLLRQVRPDARRRLEIDARPPSLLLRSFADDAADVPASSLLSRLHLRRTRLEEAVAAEVGRCGPLVAVGAPGEAVPRLGAWRVVLGDDEWQPVVRRWMRAARLVVVVAGTTPWVRWELEEALRCGAMPRTLLLVRETLAGSPWRRALDGLCPRGLLALQFLDDGGIRVLRASRREELEYRLAALHALAALLVQVSHPAGPPVAGTATGWQDRAPQAGSPPATGSPRHADR